MSHGMTAVHVTHEAVAKVGGIGAVLEGFFTSISYLKAFGRSIVIGPQFNFDGPGEKRLGENGEVLYSSVDGIANTGFFHEFRRIEEHYGTRLIYGVRKFRDPKTHVASTQEVILIDVRYLHTAPLNYLKQCLFQKFGIRSNHYEHIWEFEQYVRLAVPMLEILKAIGAKGPNATIFAHEFMGMPTALASMLNPHLQYRTVFYAHEVATMRRIVEEFPGHDTMFYNVMEKAGYSGEYVDEVFGEQNFNFKHPLVSAAKHCDAICAVGDYVKDELCFIGPDFGHANIGVVYNGILAYEADLKEKLASRELLRQYCFNLLGYRPDHVFTHVTRLVRSKGLWRDIQILEAMEQRFQKEGKTGVYILLSTEVAQRPERDILAMEASYGWPVAHREGWPDMSGGEAHLNTAIQTFNSKSRNIKAIFLNQFGFEKRFCGERMPKEMTFLDVRRGTDIEFGLSIYEPFGIAQLEPLTFGGVCVITNVCGCAGFARDVMSSEHSDNVVIVDYTNLNGEATAEVSTLIEKGSEIRERIEEKISRQVADKLLDKLTLDEGRIAERIKRGSELARHMSWDVVVDKYVLPTIDNSGRRDTGLAKAV